MEKKSKEEWEEFLHYYHFIIIIVVVITTTTIINMSLGLDGNYKDHDRNIKKKLWVLNL